MVIKLLLIQSMRRVEVYLQAIDLLLGTHLLVFGTNVTALKRGLIERGLTNVRWRLNNTYVRVFLLSSGTARYREVEPVPLMRFFCSINPMLALVAVE
jgi:hypothetical protein